jgi:dipeptidyl aminopeptidase/acylaminoacyl peptidase
VIQFLEPRLLLTAASDDQIIYKNDDSPAGFYIANSNGNNATRIATSDSDPFGAALTPDRTRMVFTTQSANANTTEIWIIGIDGNNEKRLTFNAFADDSPHVSPDGGRIVFVSNRDGNDEIYTMDLNGGDVTRLTFDGGADEDPSFSPDGTKILFSTNRTGNFEIATIDAATGLNFTRLTNNAASDRSPTYSPEGLRIAFSSDRHGAFEIWTMKATGELAGATPVRLTTSPDSDTSHNDPTFSPDGRQIAYQESGLSSGFIVRINADTGTELGSLGGPFSSDPVWASAPRFTGLSNQVVSVVGTAGADHIVFGFDENTQDLTFTMNGKTETWALALVQQVQVFCGAGNDTLDGSAGIAFYASGDAGNDRLTGSEDNDTLTGGSGANVLNGGDGDDRLNGSSASDSITGGRGSDRIYGFAGNDTLDGGDQPDHIYGGDGSDVISGGSSNDYLFGENGNDTLSGGNQNDILDGGANVDRLYGNDGNDTMYGGGGNDRLEGDDGNDSFRGGAGNDTFFARDNLADILKGDGGSDSAQFDLLDTTRLSVEASIA